MSEFDSPNLDPRDDAAPAPVEAYELSSEETTWAMLCHIAALAGFIGIPFGGILGPLVFWLIKRDQSPFVDDHGRESLNFQITVLIAILCCIPLIFIVIGFLLMVAIGIGSLICVIIAAVKAAAGEYYRYPMTIRFLK
jgi:uncharacterized Tic20 family protein